MGACFEKVSTGVSVKIEDILSFSEAILLVHDFLKEYHPNDLLLFHKMIEKKRIFHLSEMEFISERLRGQCYPSYQGLPFILQENLLETFLFTQFPDSLIFNQEYYKRSPEYLKEQLNNPLLEKIVERNLNFDYLDLTSAVRYATGSLAAIVLQEHFNIDKQHGEEVYQYYMNQRTRPFSPEILSTLEYREGDFSKILEKDVKIFSKLKN